LWVGEVGAGDGVGDGGPVGGEPAAEAVGVVAGAEVVVASFGVAFFAFEFVILRAGIDVGSAFAAEGVKIGVVADGAGPRAPELPPASFTIQGGDRGFDL
jgi:hypothetical protein